MDTSGDKNDNATVVSDDSSTAYTPTHTTERDISLHQDALCAPSSKPPCAPTPGRTYVIRHRDSGKVIDDDGRLSAVPHADMDTVCTWHCVQTGGWLGFCVFGDRFLGRDGNNAFRATAKFHLPWEWFVVTAQGNDVYHLQSPHWFLLLRWVGIGGDGRTLVDVTSSAHAALWEFVEV